LNESIDVKDKDWTPKVAKFISDFRMILKLAMDRNEESKSTISEQK